MVLSVASSAYAPVASEFIWNRPHGLLFIVMMYLNKRHKAKKEGASDEDAPADQESKEE